MDVAAPLCLQLIFEGKTDACRHQVLFSHTESHSFLADFMLFLDSKLKPAEDPEELKDWILTSHPFSVRRSSGPGFQTTSIASLAIWQFKAWKSVVADAASESLAETIVTGPNTKTA